MDWNLKVSGLAERPNIVVLRELSLGRRKLIDTQLDLVSMHYL